MIIENHLISGMKHQHRRIWIFGATGFIGQALVNYLSSNPNNQLFILFHNKMPFKNYESHNTFTGSILNIEPEIFERYPPDLIFHLARIPGGNIISRTLASEKAYRANVRLTEILENLEKPLVVVYVSGSLMYGPSRYGNPVSENARLNPVSFAKHYIRGELPWLHVQKTGKLDVRFARPGWIVGPDSWFREFFWNHYLKTGCIPCYGDGSQLMSVTGLNDCARLIDLLSVAGAPRQNLNMFTLSPVTQKYFTEVLAGKLNAGVEEVSMPRLVRLYGKTVAEALTLSIPLSTVHSGLYKNFRPLEPGLDAIFEKVLMLLEDK